MNTIRRVFLKHAIDKPREWIRHFQNAEDSGDSPVWKDFVKCEKLWTFSRGMYSQLLNECAIRIDRGETINREVHNDYTQMLIDSLDRNLVGVYQGFKAVLVVVQAIDPPLIAVIRKPNCKKSIWGANKEEVFRAIQLSWDSNTDRMRAHKAREHLCNALAQILNEEGLDVLKR